MGRSRMDRLDDRDLFSCSIAVIPKGSSCSPECGVVVLAGKGRETF
jgi:hypothetical protein